MYKNTNRGNPSHFKLCFKKFCITMLETHQRKTNAVVSNRDNTMGHIPLNPPSDWTEGESSPLSPHRHWYTLCQHATNTSSRLMSGERITRGDLPPAVVRYWSNLCQCANKTSKVVSSERITTIDLPSALLGASVTGLAWLVVASSRK